jgi:hypothetical protein
MGSIKLNVEDLKYIPICDLFYRIALDIIGPLRKTNKGNKYILFAIDHYFKWCKTKAISDHTIATTIRFLKKYIIIDMECLTLFLVTMVVNGLLNLTILARFMAFTINTQFHSGLGVIGCLKG